jgi:hypothetical protein
MGFQDFEDFGHPRHPATRTTGLLTFALAGLSPAEHTSVCWSQPSDVASRPNRAIDGRGLSPLRSAALLAAPDQDPQQKSTEPFVDKFAIPQWPRREGQRIICECVPSARLRRKQ